MVSGCTYCIEKVVEIHHKDGNHRNNKMWNLMVVCPTHHKEFHIGVRRGYRGHSDNGTIKKDRRRYKNGMNGN
jgi:hypothetical protein